MKRGREDDTHEERCPKVAKIQLELPNDCLYSVFQFCTTPYRVHVIPLVCKTWHAVSCEERSWKGLCLGELPVLELVDISGWGTGWKDLLQEYGVNCMSPLRNRQLALESIQLLTPMTVDHVSDTDVDSVLSQIVDKFKAYQTVELHAKQNQKRYEDLVKEYKELKMAEDIKDITQIASKKEMIFLKMLSKTKFQRPNIDYEDDILIEKHFRGISGKAIDVKMHLDYEAENKIVVNVAENIYILDSDSDDYVSYFIESLRCVSDEIGGKHMELTQVWEVIMEPIADLDGIYQDLFDNGCSHIESFNRQKSLDIDDSLYNIDLVDVRNPEAFEAGKKYLLNNPDTFRSAPIQYKTDQCFLSELIKKDYHILGDIPENALNSELLEYAAASDPRALHSVKTSLYEHNEKILTLIEAALLSDTTSDPLDLLEFAPDSLTDNKELMLRVLLKHKSQKVLSFVSKRLQADEDIVATALQFGFSDSISPTLFGSERIQRLIAGMYKSSLHDSPNLSYKLRELFHFRTFVLEVVKFAPLSAFRLIPPDLANDIEVIREAFKTNPTVLTVVNNPAVVYDQEIQEGLKTAVMQPKQLDLLDYAGEEIRSDKNLMMSAAMIDIHALKYASDSVRKDRDFIFKLCTSKSYSCLQYASDELKLDVDLLYSLIEPIPKSNNWYDYVRYEKYHGVGFVTGAGIYSDRIWELLKERHFLLRIVAESTTEKSVVLRWIEYAPRVFEHLPAILKGDSEIVCYTADQIALQNGRVYVLSKCLPDSLCNDREVLLKVMKVDYGAVDRIPRSLLDDKSFVLCAIEALATHRDKLLVKLSSELRTDPQVLKLVKKNSC